MYRLRPSKDSNGTNYRLPEACYWVERIVMNVCLLREVNLTPEKHASPGIGISRHRYRYRQHIHTYLHTIPVSTIEQIHTTNIHSAGGWQSKPNRRSVPCRYSNKSCPSSPRGNTTTSLCSVTVHLAKHLKRLSQPSVADTWTVPAATH